MSEVAQQPDVTLDDVLAGARAIVQHKSSRGAIGASVRLVHAMAHTVCGLDEVARLAAELLATSEQHTASGKAGDIDAEVTALERICEIEAELFGALVALRYLTLAAQETNHERAD